MNDQTTTETYGKPTRSGKPIRGRGNWQLMVFDEYGRTVRINNLRRNLILLGVGVTLLFLATLCLGALFVNERSARQDLETAFVRLQERVDTLMAENDALMARLAVLSETTAAAGEEEQAGDTAAESATPEAVPATGRSGP